MHKNWFFKFSRFVAAKSFCKLIPAAHNYLLLMLRRTMKTKKVQDRKYDISNPYIRYIRRAISVNILKLMGSLSTVDHFFVVCTSVYLSRSPARLNDSTSIHAALNAVRHVLISLHLLPSSPATLHMPQRLVYAFQPLKNTFKFLSDKLRMVSVVELLYKYSSNALPVFKRLFFHFALRSLMHSGVE